MSSVLRPGFDAVVRSPLLGVQFRDAVDGRVVADGLRVEIEDLWQPGRKRALEANRSGVFALHEFAGMRGFEGDIVDSPPAPGRFRVTAVDPLGRYVATAFSPPLPCPGLYAPASAGSPSAAPTHVPLYSAATRPLPVAMASLRTELRRAFDDDLPVPWARLVLRAGTQQLAEGLSDAAGRVLLVFPMPRPPQPALRASPGMPGTRFEWTVTLHAYGSAERSADEIPDLDDVLAQPEVTLLQGASPPVPLAPLTLTGGETLVVPGPSSPFLYVAE